MKLTHAIVALATAHLAACEPAGDESASIATVEAQLVEIEQLFSATYDGNRSRFDAYLDHFTDDLVLLHPDGEITVGKDAAHDFYFEAFDGLSIHSLDYDAPDILIDGDLAVRRYGGAGQFSVGSDPTVHTIANRYIDVLQRQDDGGWLIVWHQWTPIRN